jgi:hypothetical protein
MLQARVTECKEAGAPAVGAGAIEVDHDEATGRRPEQVVVCASCGHRVAKVDDRIEVAGRHLHICVNPAGYVYRIACYRRAGGTIGEGAWSDHYTWFAGTFWQLSCCGGCGVHLGWGFTGDGDDFHGLISDRIAQRDGDLGQS